MRILPYHYVEGDEMGEVWLEVGYRWEEGVGKLEVVLVGTISRRV